MHFRGSLGFDIASRLPSVLDIQTYDLIAVELLDLNTHTHTVLYGAEIKWHPSANLFRLVNFIGKLGELSNTIVSLSSWLKTTPEMHLVRSAI